LAGARKMVVTLCLPAPGPSCRSLLAGQPKGHDDRSMSTEVQCSVCYDQLRRYLQASCSAPKSHAHRY